ncbi:MAG: hypothetical protein N4Q32_03595 [Neisseriaceae bacterium]|nr:hypothetical protein [Neisseriaceae bacterium]
MLSRVLRLRKQVTGLKKELNKSQETVSKLMATEPTTTVVVKENITPEQGI